jgi:hypothetical protein
VGVDLLEKPVTSVGVYVVRGPAQDVARDAVLAQKFVSSHGLAVGGLTALGQAMGVMHFLRPVHTNPHGEAFCCQEAAPFFIDEGAVGLNPVDDPTVRGLMLALQFNDLVKVVQSEQGRLPAVPGKRDNRIGTGFRKMYFQNFLRHAKGLVVVEASIFQVVTEVAVQVTD